MSCDRLAIRKRWNDFVPLRAHIGVPDGIAVADLVRGTDLDDLAGVEYEDALAQFEYKPDIMLDQEHADPELARDPFDDGREIMAFMFGHAGCGLVQQQIARIAHDGAADGNAPLVGVGQGPGDGTGQVRYAQPVHHALGLGDRGAPCLAEADAGDLKVVEDRKSTRLNSSQLAISYAVFCL